MYSSKPPTAPDSAQPAARQFVAYCRVSTQRQGESGLGLEAQQYAVEAFVRAHGGQIIAGFTETESGKRASNRPELQRALEMCRKRRAVLVIAKLDRLARNVHFIAGLLESGVEFIAADQPTRDRFWLHMQAAFSEEEARRISIRTREALAAAKLRGVDIGATGRIRAAKLKAAAIEKAEDYRPVLQEVMAEGFMEFRAIRDEFNRRGIPSPGGGRWHLPNLHRLYRRLLEPLPVRARRETP